VSGFCKDGRRGKESRERRYYKRTSFGREVARLESERLRALLDIAHTQKILKRVAR